MVGGQKPSLFSHQRPLTIELANLALPSRDLWRTTMRYPLALLILVCCALTAVAGCGRKVSVVDPNTSIHLSGRWNDDDSKVVSNEMIDQCMKGAWLINFRDRTARAPLFRVSAIQNRSNEGIATGVFTNDLERAAINSGRVRVVGSRAEAELQREERADVQANSTQAPASRQEQAPDFILQGSINVQHDAHGDNTVKFYQVDLKLIDITTNETVWIGSTERKKTIED
jgi:penicillin-binding protein activator